MKGERSAELATCSGYAERSRHEAPGCRNRTDRGEAAWGAFIEAVELAAGVELECDRRPRRRRPPAPHSSRCLCRRARRTSAMKADGWPRSWPCGEGAVLSHRSAGGAMADRAGDPVVEVTVPGDGGRGRRRGIRLHRSLSLSPADCTRRAGIPVTKPARTLRGPAAHPAQRAVRPSPSPGGVPSDLPLGDAISPDHTRSDLEALFLALCPSPPPSPAGGERPRGPVRRRFPLAGAAPNR